MPPLNPKDYHVAWLAPLEIEVQAALCMLDKIHTGGFPVGPGDDYVFHAGEINGHNVVIATFAAGQPYGTNSATSLASHVRRFFPNLWFGLLVGVAAGLPNISSFPLRDIRLGDVIVAMPDGESPAIVPYGLGKQKGETGFELLRSGHSLPQTERIVGSAIGKIKAEGRDTQAILDHYKIAASKTDKFRDPGQLNDSLFISDEEKPVLRSQRPESERSRVWYGAIGSGDKLLKSASDRDDLRDKYGLIGLEMEAAGVMNEIPVGNIRGVCDYGDERKNKEWQPYAAIMAAAYAKALLMEIEAKTRNTSTDDGFTSEDKQCLQEMLLTNPDDDRKRIEEIKGGLLNDSLQWILDHPKFCEWYNKTDSQLLWIKGDAGKGKTMLMIGLIKKLLHDGKLEPSRSLVYFLCQAADPKLNNATAVLRGLIYMMVVQQPQLIQYLRKRYDLQGRKLFDGGNAFYGLSSILEDMIKNSQCTTTYLLIDALDECEEGLSDLLRLIVKTGLLKSPHVKWVVSSRNKGNIEDSLQAVGDFQASQLSLELNAPHVSFAVETYINYGISQLGLLRNDKSLQEQVRVQLHQKSDNTFLWVSLVIQDLQKCRHLAAMMDKLESIPQGLSALYDRMIQQIRQLEQRDRELMVLILSITTLAYRPLHLQEMLCLVNDNDTKYRLNDLKAAVDMDGSVLSTRDDHVYFVHQSAKDYINNHASSDIFGSGRSQVHCRIFQQSLRTLSTKLHRNMYQLDSAGIPSSQIAKFRPNPDPMVELSYGSTFWLDHFLEIESDSRIRSGDSELAGIADFFTTHLLHWLESLSLIGEVPHGILTLRRLVYQEQIEFGLEPVEPQKGLLNRLLGRVSPPQKEGLQPHVVLRQAERLANSYGSIIGEAPLQAYTTPLIFCPQKSQSKNLYWKDRLEFIDHVFGTQELWDPYLKLLDGHAGQVDGVAFSPDGRLIASGSYDCNIRLWDAATGIETRVLPGDTGVNAVAFSPDGKLLASASDGRTVHLWDTTSFAYQVLEGHSGMVHSVAFSPDGKTVASASSDSTVRLWDTAGVLKHILQEHTKPVNAVVFSRDGKLLASASDDCTAKLWDTATGLLKETLGHYDQPVNKISFSPNGESLASASRSFIFIWDVATGRKKNKIDEVFTGPSQWFTPHTGTIRALVFSQDGHTLVSAGVDRNIVLWDASNWRVRRIFKGHTESIRAVAFSPSGQLLASASEDSTIRIWDTAIDLSKKTPRKAPPGTEPIFREPPRLAKFNVDGSRLAVVEGGNLMLAWGTTTSSFKVLSLYDPATINAVTFSPDTKILAAAYDDGTIKFWDMASGKKKNVLMANDVSVNKVAFSSGSGMLASASNDGMIRLWDVTKGTQVSSHDQAVTALLFSDDGSPLNTAKNSITVQPSEPQDAEGRITFPDRWICCDGEKLILVPPEYEFVSADHETIILRHFTGNIVFLKLKLPAKSGPKAG